MSPTSCRHQMREKTGWKTSKPIQTANSKLRNRTIKSFLSRPIDPPYAFCFIAGFFLLELYWTTTGARPCFPSPEAVLEDVLSLFKFGAFKSTSGSISTSRRKSFNCVDAREQRDISSAATASAPSLTSLATVALRAASHAVRHAVRESTSYPSRSAVTVCGLEHFGMPR